MHNDDDDDLMVLWLPFGLVQKDNFIDFMVRNVPGVSLPYPTTLTDDVANWKVLLVMYSNFTSDLSIFATILCKSARKTGQQSQLKNK